MNVIQKSRHGIVLYNPRDAYIGKSFAEYGEFSKEESDLFASVLRPGDIALDIGANIGAHLIAMANALKDHQTRLTTAEGKITTLEGKVSTLETQMTGKAATGHTH